MATNYAAQFQRVLEEAFSKGDLQAVDTYFTPNFIEHEPGPGQGKGREGVKTIITAMRTAFPDLRATIRDSGISGDKLWARVEFSGTNTGEMMGKPPSGRRATFEALDCVRFEGDKLAEHWGAIDMFGLLIQLGHIPAPTPPVPVQ